MINTARKTVFPRSSNIMESSKTPSKYHVPINFLAQKKTVFPISKKFKTRTFQQSVNILFPRTFGSKKRPFFGSPKSSKQKLFSNQ